MLDLLPECLKEWQATLTRGSLPEMNREGRDAGLGHTMAENNP